MKNRIMLDTNVLISFYISNGICRKAVNKLLNDANNDVYISEYIDNEFRDIIYRKWSSVAKEVIEIYKNSGLPILHSSPKILAHTRDKKDDQVLSDSIYNNIDILLTGDKDIKVNAGKHKVKILSISDIAVI